MSTSSCQQRPFSEVGPAGIICAPASGSCLIRVLLAALWNPLSCFWSPWSSSWTSDLLLNLLTCFKPLTCLWGLLAALWSQLNGSLAPWLASVGCLWPFGTSSLLLGPLACFCDPWHDSGDNWLSSWAHDLILSLWDVARDLSPCEWEICVVLSPWYVEVYAHCT